VVTTVNRSDLPQDHYRYTPERASTLAEQLTLGPVAPTAIRERIDDGERLATTDIPTYLGKPIATNTDASIALYRLIQLFGTPNVPGLEAGAPQPMREKTTWQYLFEVEYDPGEDPLVEGMAAGEYLVSVYDYKTNLSVGLASWYRPDEDPDRWALEPSGEPLPSGELPEDPFLAALVQLVLSTVEHAVEATHEDLHV